MGEKITIDSATLMNKGLEVIEAHHLFGLPYERIEVVVHPQSVVHALVRMVDGALLAHLGVADMRVPIAYALHYPERAPVAVAALDLAAGMSLEFEAPDEDTFPAIGLAREAGAKGDAATCALNAANEVAVRSFLEGVLPFPGIAEVVREVVQASEAGPSERMLRPWPSTSGQDARLQKRASHVSDARMDSGVYVVGIIVAIVGLGFLILAHEFGHFIVAKATGMRVEEFSLGFGPFLVSRRVGETVYGISAVPLGGYVRVTGMHKEEFEARVAEAREPEAEDAVPSWRSGGPAGPRGPAGRQAGAERRGDRRHSAREALLLPSFLAQAALHRRRRDHELDRRLPAHLDRGRGPGRATSAPRSSRRWRLGHRPPRPGSSRATAS